MAQNQNDPKTEISLDELRAKLGDYKYPETTLAGLYERADAYERAQMMADLDFMLKAGYGK